MPTIITDAQLKLMIQNLLTEDLVKIQKELSDLALNSEFDRLAWMLTIEKLAPSLKKNKIWDLRKKIILNRGRALSVNALSALVQIAIASRKDSKKSIDNI